MDLVHWLTKRRCQQRFYSHPSVETLLATSQAAEFFLNFFGSRVLIVNGEEGSG